MKKKFFIIAGLVIILLGIVIISIKLLNNKYEDEVEIILPSNGGVPFEWSYTIGDEEIVKFKEETSKAKDKVAVGGKVEKHYFFTGLKEGQTTIKFEYKNLTTDQVEKVKEYGITVNKKLKVEVVEII